MARGMASRRVRWQAAAVLARVQGDWQQLVFCIMANAHFHTLGNYAPLSRQPANRVLAHSLAISLFLTVVLLRFLPSSPPLLSSLPLLSPQIFSCSSSMCEYYSVCVIVVHLLSISTFTLACAVMCYVSVLVCC